MKMKEILKNRSSSKIAKDRLKVVLVSDRANCSPDIIENIKNDMIHLLSKYVQVDMDRLDITITTTTEESNEETVPTIMASIPFKEIR